ncbi:sulfite exporter TauE/SafE family protein [Aliifodinibius sp. S!AR15-10]|uniref:sulfite exporter TauE/SafE family protein n=1 Tax=Aliifodinibius sp. S!AR15-10 TaxID=2950437 RepID=UPI00286727A1|nr:sulfite exporter TauE/SafE family protein [Aliifodinibius sp. S!AR15-10]MDR8393749.1 sulfite exporter TauE/SafE family protein [Aliifodinibius sp. S!AR15-10]
MILSWIGALLVGLSLGLMGSGGSILTVPVLIYLAGEQEKVAIAESLGIVGAISLAGFVPYALKKQVHWKSVILFGLPGMAGTYGGAIIAGYVSGTFQLMLFAAVMVIAAVLMFRDKAKVKETNGDHEQHAWWKITIEGLVVGILTGLVGVGGGFLIVPALVLLGGLPMHLAIGTSLIIIAMKSFSGFFKYIDVLENLDLSMNWSLVLVFSLIGAVGSLVGKRIGSNLTNESLKQGFAVFLVGMGGYIIYMNAFTG